MPKHPNSKSKQVKRDEPMTGAMKFFLAGCVAELYLLIIRRFYVKSPDIVKILWYDRYLWVLLGVGAAILVAGVVGGLLLRGDKKKRTIAWCVAAAGAFLGGAAGLIRWNASTLTLLTVVVPVVMVLGVLWNLYDRECALSLTILGASLIALWICRKQMYSMFLGTYVKIFAVVYILVLIAVALLTKQGKLKKLLPASADPLPVYVACGLSAVAMLGALFSSIVAYYAMWALAIVVFGLAVYYTVKQL
ncbi:hypothetical protein JQM66_09900 [Oscillibacter valericigenes]|uniref:hypothetical protein n=1 Tax=Oscillibacter valericigenes TaxID=351091 RepID=UPI001F2242E2|nr:hypothetical protein [Oscillibacter valericigenes]MCF2664868.1 hypothetical protein [Oscillibacter valericigenes]